MMKPGVHISLHWLLACALSWAAGAFAQAPAFPSKPVRIVIPVPPGGVQDLLARAFAQELSSAWGQSVLTENRPGAGGVSAAEAVAHAAPDGHTIFMADEVPFTITPILHTKLSYDPASDFTPVIALVQASHLVAVSANSGIGSLKELIAQARAKPGSINYGTFGVGSTAHLNTEELATLADMRVTHVPYKGGADVLRAVVAGDIQFAIVGLTPSRPLIKQGRLKALAYTGTRRLASMPDLPTVAEAGVPGFSTRSWFGWVVPAGTPRPVVEKIAADTGHILTSASFKQKVLDPAAVEALNLGPDQFPQLMKDTRAKYEAQIRRLNFSVEAK